DQAVVGRGMRVTVVALAASTAFVLREQAKTRAAYEREQQSFQQARDAVDRFTQLIDERLADAPPHLQALRQEALEASLAYYQGFIDQRGDDPALRDQLAATRTRVEKLLADLAVMQGFGATMLLGKPDVLDDLKLNPDQRKELEGLSHGFRQRHHGFLRGPGMLNPEQRQTFLQQADAQQQQ